VSPASVQRRPAGHRHPADHAHRWLGFLDRRPAHRPRPRSAAKPPTGRPVGKTLAAVAYTSAVDVLLLLIRDHQVLLALRAGTGFADGWWNLPSGKLEEGEDAATAVIREAREEIGLTLDRDSLALASTVHYRNEREIGRLGLFFQARRWGGEPVNAEPHKCAQ